MIHEMGVLLAAVDDASGAYQTGRAIPIILTLWGIWKCWAICGRPQTNSKSIIALMLILIGWFAAMVGGVAQKEMPDSVVLKLLSAVILMLLTPTSIVLAILGLVEIRREPKYTQGKSQAIWTLVFGTIVVGAFVFGLIAGILKSSQREAEFAEKVRTKQPAENEELKFPDKNFSFRALPKPWVKVDAAKFNSNATLGFMRSKPQIFCMIIAEKLGEEAEVDNEMLVEVVKSNLKSAVKSSEIVEEKPHKINGVEGTLVRTNAEVSGSKIVYTHWVAAAPGSAFQLIAWGQQKEGQEVHQCALDIFSNFKLLDATKASSLQATRTFSSPHYGYIINLEKSPLKPWVKVRSEVPEAEFGATNKDIGGMAIVPLVLRGEKPSLEALTHGFLKRIGLEYPSKQISHWHECKDGKLGGHAFRMESTTSGEFWVYSVKVLQDDERALLAYCWVRQGHASELDGMEQVLSSLHFTRPALPQRSVDFADWERKAHGLIFNDIGIHYYRAKQYAQAAPFMKQALEFMPDNAVILINLANTYTGQKKTREAYEMLLAHIPRVKGNTDVQARVADLQEDLEMHAEAAATYQAMFATGYDNEPTFRKYLSVLEKLNEADRAHAEIEKFRQKHNTLTVDLLEIELWQKEKQYDKAVARLKARQEKVPFNEHIAKALIDNYYLAGKHAEGVAVAKEMIENGFDSADAFYRKGQCEVGMKSYREAKASFEAAYKLEPNDASTVDYLRLISGMLGEGDNSLIKSPIEAVPLPAALATEPLKAMPADYMEDYHAVYERRVGTMRFEKHKYMTRTDYRTILLKEPSALARFSTFFVPFDPLSEDVYVNSLVVRNEAGAEVASGKVSDYFVIDENAATHRKTLHIPVPGLKPGYRIDFVCTHREKAGAQMPFFEYGMSWHYPVQRSALFVSGDIEALKWKSGNMGEPRKVDGGLLWTQDCAPIWRYEPHQLSSNEYMPTVWLGDAAANWEEEGKAYLQSIRELMTPEPQIKQLAAKITAGLKSDSEKIAALSGHVQRDYTYKAIEFGRRARIPHSGVETANHKYGDCKDHALLLHLLLQSEGIASHLALVKSYDEPIVEAVPSLDQFNHMVVYLPSEKGGRFIDCTDKDSDTSGVVPYGLSEHTALLLDPARMRLERIGAYPAESSLMTIERSARVNDAQDLVVEEFLTLTGYCGSALRGAYRHVEPAHRITAMQRDMSDSGQAVQVQDLKFEGLEEAGKPLVVRVSYIVKRAFHSTGEQWVGRMPSYWEQYYLQAEACEKRVTPFAIRFPLVLKSATLLTLPRGYKALNVEALSHKFEKDFGSWKLACDPAPGALKLQMELTRGIVRGPAASYALYQESMDKLLSAYMRDVVLKKE